MSTPEESVGTVVEAVKLEGPQPLRLLADWEIREREARLLRAEEAARRLARPPEEPPDVVQQLVQQGAVPELRELTRRQQLPPEQRQAEEAARAQHRAAQSVRRAQPVAALPAPTVAVPQLPQDPQDPQAQRR
ncbi:hypothetical protein [Streptomyces sp. NBC_01431]|uniref:hypothetical protein n=1 Tax=Streptomyces sp. NBC_01431 TaxID=2903863 RepID=UPI002E334943|nr:hypothetical protein [Streptomyces sp. NBC_01431]